MSADEFIEQYGRIEMLKIMKAEGDSDAGGDFMSRGSLDRAGSTGRASNIVGIADMKGMMRDSLMKNVKTYDTLDTRDDQHHLSLRDDSKDFGNSKRAIKSPAPTRGSKLTMSSSTTNIITSHKKVTTPMVKSTKFNK